MNELRLPIAPACDEDMVADVFTRSSAAAPAFGAAVEMFRAAPTLAPVTLAGTFDPAPVLASVGEAAYEWTLATDALLWSDNAPAVLGLADASVLANGRSYAALLDPTATSSRFDAVNGSSERDAGSGVAYRIEYALRCDDSTSTQWIEDTGRWFAGSDGKPARAHGVIRVINDRHAQETELAYLSQHDAQTGEMNRARLTEVLATTLEETVGERRLCSVLLVAIDNLARMNEAYGFDIADEVICAVAKRLRTKMRGGDHLGRFSGNKFALILNNCSPEDLDIAAERLLAGVRDDLIRTAAGPVAATVTIGGVTAPRHAKTIGDIFARAQEALDQAKAKRRGSFLTYRPNVEREAIRRDNSRAADEIVASLNERRILLAFEPVVRTDTWAPAFYECLMRIRRPDGAIAPAAQVVPLAERLGLIRMLDHRVLELLVSEMAAIPSLHASVNVSPNSTIDPAWWSALGALLRANAGVAERLVVEITETAAIQDIDDMRGFVARVKDLGCRIAIDDFGSGYTSFRNLRKLGVDILKIDGSFVSNMTYCDDDRAFVQTLIELAQRLGLSTVAEWVQDETAAALLASWGCDHLQGRLIGLATIERPWGEIVPVDRRRNARR